jgi:hypothetical protein
MRFAIASTCVALMCLAGYGLAFQEPSKPRDEFREEQPRSSIRSFPPSAPQREHSSHKAAPQAIDPIEPKSVVSPPTSRDGRYASQAIHSVPTTLPEQPAWPVQVHQHLAVVISKAGLRFLSGHSDVNLDEIELKDNDILVICDSADVTTGKDGKQEIVCRNAGVIRTNVWDGSAGELRYKADCLVLESEGYNSFITRNGGDKASFMLKAKSISIDLNNMVVRTAGGSPMELKIERDPSSPTECD